MTSSESRPAAILATFPVMQQSPAIPQQSPLLFWLERQPEKATNSRKGRSRCEREPQQSWQYPVAGHQCAFLQTPHFSGLVSVSLLQVSVRFAEEAAEV